MALADGSCNVRSDLTHFLTVIALDQNFGLTRGFDGDAFRRDVDHRMRKTQRQVQILALGSRTVTHADQLQLAFKPGADTDNHVIDQCAGQTML